MPIFIGIYGNKTCEICGADNRIGNIRVDAFGRKSVGYAWEEGFAHDPDVSRYYSLRCVIYMNRESD